MIEQSLCNFYTYPRFRILIKINRKSNEKIMQPEEREKRQSRERERESEREKQSKDTLPKINEKTKAWSKVL